MAKNEETKTSGGGRAASPPRGAPEFRAQPFDYERLDAFHVAKEALRIGDPLFRSLPRGYAQLSDQGRRALLSGYLNIAEASSRDGADRRARFRTARGESSEAAAATDAVLMLELADLETALKLRHLLARLCAMLTRLMRASA
jgi:four helix bundle protein